jgi:hypothetical protein
MFVRSRGGWLRRAIASGATFLVALGAVLVTPSSAFAADPSIVVSSCGAALGNRFVSGSDMPTPTAFQFFVVEAYAPDGHQISSKNADVGADHRLTALVPLDNADLGFVRFTAALWERESDPDGHGPPFKVRDLAEAYMVVGCGQLSPDEYTIQQNNGGPQTISLSFGDFKAGTPISLTGPAGITLTPSVVLPTLADPEPTVDITLSKQPPCGPSTLAAVQFEADVAGHHLERRQDTTIQVKCPTLTASPASVDDVALPRSVALSGDGWYGGGEDLPVTLDGVQVGTAQTNNTGQLTATAAISQRDCGPQVITVAQDVPIVIGLRALTTSAGALAEAAPSVAAAPAFAPIDELVKTVTVNVDCVDPALAAQPALMVERDGPQTLAVRPTDFRTSQPVKLSLPGTVITPDVITPDPEDPGHVFTVTLDKQPACGENALTGRQEPYVAGKPAKTATARVYVVCPRLTLTPENVQDVKLPDPVTVNGTGWVPGANAVISYDGAPAAEVRPEKDGLISKSIDVPQSDCGKHTVVVRQVVTEKDNTAPLPRARETTEVTQTAVLNVDCSTPFVSASPQAMAAKAGPQKIDVRVSGFLLNLPVTLSVPGVTLAPNTLTPTRTSPGEGTITLNKQPACGESTLTASQVRTGGEFPVNRTATVRLVVFCPSFAVNPASVPDTALPGKVTGTGTNWVPNQPIQVLIDGKATNTVTPNDKGVLEASQIKVQRLGCGKHVIEAVQVVAPSADPEKTHLPVIEKALELRAKAGLTVVCTPAFLSADPPVIGDGNTTVAAGVGFTPGRKVLLTWTYLDGSPMADACTADVSAGGTFLVTCLALPNSALGTRLMKAVETVPPGDPVIARFGQAEVLVVPGSMAPKHGRFLERR